MVSDNLITGKWVVLGLYEYQHGQSIWQYADPLRPGLVIWDFSEALKAFYNDKPDYTTDYEFMDSDNKLTINLSYLTNPEELAIRDKAHYRVSQPSERELWLYDLEGVKKEPDDYWLAMRLIKIDS